MISELSGVGGSWLSPFILLFSLLLGAEDKEPSWFFRNNPWFLGLSGTRQIRSSGEGGVATTWETTGVSPDQLMPELAPEGQRGLADVGKGVRDARKGTA